MQNAVRRSKNEWAEAEATRLATTKAAMLQDAASERQAAVSAALRTQEAQHQAQLCALLLGDSGGSPVNAQYSSWATQPTSGAENA